jgi:hypothetical protein
MLKHERFDVQTSTPWGITRCDIAMKGLQRELGNQNWGSTWFDQKRSKDQLWMIAIAIASATQGKEEFIILVIGMTKSSESC